MRYANGWFHFQWVTLNYLMVGIGLLGVLVAGCATISPTAMVSPLVTPTVMESPSPTVSPTYAPVPGLTTLTLWVPDFLDLYTEATGAAVLAAQIEEFTRQSPNIQVRTLVKKDVGPGGSYHLLSTAYDAAPSTLPDLVVLSATDVRAAIRGNLVQSFHLSAEDKEDYFSFALLSHAVEEPVYAIPYVARVEQMAYRRGVSATPPLSWTGVLEAKYSLLFPAGALDGRANDALVAMYLGVGGALVDQANAPVLERVPLEALYDFFLSLLDRHLINPDRALSAPDALTCWKTYQQGISRLSAVPAGVYWNRPPVDSFPTWVPTPTGKPIAIAHFWSLALVTTDAARQESALRLAHWLTDPERMATLTHNAALMPTRFQALRAWALAPGDTVFLEQLLGSAIPTSPAAIDEPIRRALQAGLSAVLKREVHTAAQAADIALAQLEE